MLRRIALFPVLLLTVAAAGCIQTPSAPSAPADVTLITTDAAGLEAAIAAHKGKVVLVDYWATWCVPCIKAFPHTVALSRKYADKPFVAISVSVDTAEELADAKAFLAEHNAKMEHYIGSYPSTEEAMTGFGLKDESVPELRLYDKEGKLQETWKKFEEADVEAKVQELLGK